MGCTDNGPLEEGPAVEPASESPLLTISLLLDRKYDGTRVWTVTAERDSSPEYDASGATPLEAMTVLAELLYEELSSQ